MHFHIAYHSIPLFCSPPLRIEYFLESGSRITRARVTNIHWHDGNTTPPHGVISAASIVRDIKHRHKNISSGYKQ
jgi:hypothetical protein